MNSLIIEDDLGSFLVLKSMLRMYLSIHADNCTTTESAKIFLETNSPSIIFVDLRLEGEDGLTFLMYRGQSERLSDIPLIVTSGHSDMKAISACLKNGADAYLIKPVQNNLLISTVRSILNDYEQRK